MRRLFGLPIAFIALLTQSVYLALGQIWANKIRATLTTIGIVIGVASVTAVIAATTGLKAKVMTEFETFGTNTVYVMPHWPDRGPHEHASWHKIRFYPDEFDNLLEHCPSVERFSFISWGSRRIHFGEDSIDNVRIRGINPSWHQIQNRSITAGRPFSVIDEDRAWQVCLITSEVQKELHLDRDCVGQTIFISNRPFRIVGMVQERGWLEGGGGSKSEIMIPFNTAWKLWRPWMGVMVSSKTPELVEDAQAELRFFLRRERHLKPNEPDTFRLESIERFLDKIKQLSVVLTAVAGGIVSISLLVGGVGIMNIMLVSVSERTREIGLRKAVGAKPSAILFQFLIEAVILCLFGGLIGLGLGQLLTSVISNIPKAPLEQAHIPVWAVILAFGFSAFVGVFFGMFPAVKAAQLDPIEALRHE